MEPNFIVKFEDEELPRIEPDTTGAMHKIVRPKVLLPQPDSPASPRHSPEKIRRVTPSTARTHSVGFPQNVRL